MTFVSKNWLLSYIENIFNIRQKSIADYEFDEKNIFTVKFCQ